MSKIHIHSCMKQMLSKEEFIFDGKGILTDSKITYYEKDVVVTIFNMKNRVRLVRKGKGYHLEMEFSQNERTMATYQFSDKSNKIYLQVETKVLEWGNNEINLNYRLLQDSILEEFEYKLRFEVIE